MAIFALLHGRPSVPRASFLQSRRRYTSLPTIASFDDPGDFLFRKLKPLDGRRNATTITHGCSFQRLSFKKPHVPIPQLAILPFPPHAGLFCSEMFPHSRIFGSDRLIKPRAMAALPSSLAFVFLRPHRRRARRPDPPVSPETAQSFLPFGISFT